MNKKTVSAPLFIVICVLALVLGFVLQYVLFPNGMKLTEKKATEDIAYIDANDDFKINEVMSKNTSAIMNSQGEYADWVELINTGSGNINIGGYKLAKTNNSVKYFEFPEQILAPGETVLVFCTNKSNNTLGYEYQAPFKLSAAGENLYLFNSSDVAVQTIQVPALEGNRVYRLNNGNWEISTEYTPGLLNTKDNHEAIKGNVKLTDSPIKINEFMAKNVSYVPDEDGEYHDWIELYNTSSQAVSLNGWYLSDSDQNPFKWQLPDVTIQGNGYLLVYASGKDRRDPNNALHTNFKLSTEKEGLYLTNNQSQIVDSVTYDILKADQSYSRNTDGSWTVSMSPTPSMENSKNSAALIDSQFAAQNPYGVYISEVMASTNDKNKNNPKGSDWIELYNANSVAIDLSNIGVSDDPSKPRKWQFPQGATIQPNEYMVLILSGENTTQVITSGFYQTNFSLSAAGGETVVLSDPSGKIFDRCYLDAQYTNLPYGRLDGLSGFYYLQDQTPLSKNLTNGYYGRCAEPKLSADGGLYKTGDTVTVSITAQPGENIFYTLDCSDPTSSSTLYTGPIEITSTTIVRAIAIREGMLNSLIATQSYFFDLNHTFQVVSLVTDPKNLFDEDYGIYVKGKNASEEFPYTGANYWKDWEREAHIEIYTTDGATVIDNGCGIKLHGQYSRAESQKAFKIFARRTLGTDSFKASLFPNRDYTEYSSFLLRNSGQDHKMSRMRDSLLTSLAAGTGVMYQDYAQSVVYLNGEYWGHYYLREHISTNSICQFENWQDPDNVDLVKANTNTMQATDDLPELLDWMKKNSVTDPENLKVVEEQVDIENYLHYIALEMFVGNTDTLNVKRYRNKVEGDGRWKWILFDLDWAFYTDTDSFSRWQNPKGMGNQNRTNNTLFIELMKNTTVRARFFEILDELMSTTCTSENIMRLINERDQELQPELQMQFDKWDQGFKNYNTHLNKLKTYCNERPKKLLTYIMSYYGWSKEELEQNMPNAYKTVVAYEESMKNGAN